VSAETDAGAARRVLDSYLASHAWALQDGFADRAERYVALLLDTNARLNLTRVVEPDAVARLHLVDSLAALRLVDDLGPNRALDLGSGGGVPGLVLAMARPDVAWTLAESVRKKAEALAGFAAALALANVEVVAERAETLGRDPVRRERYDLVTARACAALPVLAEYAIPLLRPGGVLLAWKGRIGHAELADGARATAVLGGSEPRVVPTGVPELGDHCFVTVRKEGATPDAYPRRPGEPARRPLR